MLRKRFNIAARCAKSDLPLDCGCPFGQNSRFLRNAVRRNIMDRSEVSMPGDDASRHSDIAGFVIDRFLLHHLLRMPRQMDGDFESLMIWSTLDLQRAANSLPTDSKMAPISLPPNARSCRSAIRKMSARPAFETAD